MQNLQLQETLPGNCRLRDCSPDSSAWRRLFAGVQITSSAAMIPGITKFPSSRVQGVRQICEESFFLGMVFAALYCRSASGATTGDRFVLRAR